MFRSKIGVITIGKNIVTGELVNPNRKFAVVNKIAYKWNKKTLLKVIKEIVAGLKTKKLRLLVDENFAYTLTATQSKGVADKAEAKELIRRRIPDDLDNCLWGYQLEKDNRELVQYVIITQYLSKIIRAIQENLNVEFEIILPQSMAIASEVSQKIPSFILIHKDDFGALGVVVSVGKVLLSKEILGDITKSTIDEMVGYAAKRFEFETKELVVSGDVDTKNIVKSKDFHISKWTELLASSLAKYEQPKKVIGTLPLKLVANEENETDSKNSNLQFLIIGLVAILGLFIGIGGAWYWTTLSQDTVQTKEQSQILIQGSDQQVLDSLAAKLLELGIQSQTEIVVQEVDQTSINYATDERPKIVDQIDSILGDYNVIENATLTRDSNYDVVLVVGKINN